MNTKQKRKSRKRAKELWRKQVKTVRALANKMGLAVIAPRYGEVIRLMDTHNPYQPIIQGEISHIEMYVTRYWNLRAFL